MLLASVDAIGKCFIVLKREKVIIHYGKLRFWKRILLLRTLELLAFSEERANILEHQFAQLLEENQALR